MRKKKKGIKLPSCCRCGFTIDPDEVGADLTEEICGDCATDEAYANGEFDED